MRVFDVVLGRCVVEFGFGFALVWCCVVLGLVLWFRFGGWWFVGGFCVWIWADCGCGSLLLWVLWWIVLAVGAAGGWCYVGFPL